MYLSVLYKICASTVCVPAAYEYYKCVTIVNYCNKSLDRLSSSSSGWRKLETRVMLLYYKNKRRTTNRWGRCSWIPRRRNMNGGEKNWSKFSIKGAYALSIGTPLLSTRSFFLLARGRVLSVCGGAREYVPVRVSGDPPGDLRKTKINLWIL